MTNAFDVKVNLEGILTTKLEEVNVELTETQKDAVVSILLDNRVLTVDRVVDLDDFVHYSVSEGEDAPVKTLLVNHLLVYVFEGERVIKAHGEDYQEYLEDNDLYEDEYPYDQFLRDNELVETFPTETYSYAIVTEIGALYLNALKEKQVAQERLDNANNIIENIHPIISENFLQISGDNDTE